VKQPIYVVDTSVIILSAAPTRPNDPTHIKSLRELTEIAVESTIKHGAKLVVPTPVIAELGRDGPGSVVYKAFVKAIRGRIRTAPLTVSAADVAGAMRRSALRQRADGQERGAVLYDALIAALAHDIEARWLITANPRDMKRCLAAVQSAVEIIDTTVIPDKGQLHLVHQNARSVKSDSV
jgi:predicted nucleic acid-binding protein